MATLKRRWGRRTGGGEITKKRRFGPLPIQVQVASEVVEVAIGPFALYPSRQFHQYFPRLHVGCVAQALKRDDKPTEIKHCHRRLRHSTAFCQSQGHNEPSAMRPREKSYSTPSRLHRDSEISTVQRRKPQSLLETAIFK